MAATPKVVSIDEVRAQMYAGESVALDDWVAARRRQEDGDSAERFEAEFNEVAAIGRTNAERSAAVVKARADIAAFKAADLTAARKAYKTYVTARQRLSEVIDAYDAARRPLVANANMLGLSDTEMPDPISKHGMLHVADLEAQGHPVQPHFLQSGLTS